MIQHTHRPESGYGTDSIPITLPPFLRTSWVGDDARSVWEPRFRECAAAWQELELAAAVEGLRACAVTAMSAERLVEGGSLGKRGLVQLPLEFLGAGGRAVHGDALHYRVVVGTVEHAHRFREAFEAADESTLGELLGCPPCCREALRDATVEGGVQDPTWFLARNSPRAAGATGSEAPSPRVIELEAAPSSNVLWRWLGLRLVPHLPCSADCPRTARVAEEFARLAEQQGLGAAHRTLVEILSWPAEWSALHGIAEIRTPVLKFVVPTDGTRSRYAVRWRGSRRPPESAKGLDFVYRAPAKRKVTASAAFREGIENPIRELGPRSEAEEA